MTSEAKATFRGAFITISAEETGTEFSEAAFPAYAHKNPLIQHLFWGRLAAVEEHWSGRQLGSVLDFGCGSGVMSYILSALAQRVVATDIEPCTFNKMREKVSFPGNVIFAPIQEIACTREHSFDAIVALDVLEHVNDLPETLGLFRKLLKPSAEAVISGPTENIMYKVGRWIAGRRFTGEYHVTDIRQIRERCTSYGAVTKIKTLYPFLPFFDIFSVRMN